MKRWTAIALVTISALTTAPVNAQEPLIIGAERFFRVEWQQGQDRKGEPVVEGYVYNASPRPAERMTLLVEALDSSGARVASSLGPVAGTVPNDNRAYFKLKAPRGGHAYRVRVYSFDWVAIDH